MRKPLSLLLFVFALAHAATGRGENPAPLTRLLQVVSLTNPQAAQHLPVRFEATVTFVEPQDANIFVQDAGKAVYITFAKDIGLRPGDRILVTGTTDASFRPEIEASDVQIVGHDKLPAPQKADFEGLIQSKFDCQYVTVRGRVLAAAFDQEQPQPGIRIQVQIPQGMIGGRIAHPGNLDAAKLLDTEVDLTGVAGGAFDSKMQMTGVWLDIYSADDVKFVQSQKEDAWSTPLVAMDDVIAAYRQSNQSQRVRIQGTLTYFEPAALAVVEANGRSMLVKTDSTLPLHAGMGVEATGFPSISEESVSLDYGQLRRSAQADQLQPKFIDWENAANGKFAYNLVAMEGEIVGEVHDSRVDLFILRSGGHLFSATLRHSSSDAGQQSSAASTPAVGSRVRVIGVCFLDAGNHWRDQLWFSIRMRSLDDVVVLQEPEWWTVKRMTYIVMALSVFILVAVIWAGVLDRQLRRQGGVMARQSQEDAIRERRLARQEQQRGRILELISSPAPLAEVLQEIQTTVSARLYGAACWFELSASAGAASRSKPERPDTPEVVSQELFSRDGTSLGYLMATPLVKSSAESDIPAILSAGARLAELAIDTRRLYSDLRHRSEYDLLTDIPNRFSMEKTLDRLMQLARSDGKAFGLIYVDLDRFKQVNDRHGHRVGDLYLQAVTGRMKQQLRNGDVLARIGGDEFIALVPIVRSREDAEEIAMRLEHCFDDPFDLEGLTMRGSASVGLAVYPEDGTTEEELQRSADAAMYAHKEYRRHPEVTA
jgi:diguanylate cyclase (GGDEF)-like protein